MEKNKENVKEAKPEEFKMHENGVMYREFVSEGFDEPVRLFNTPKPGRLKGETKVEYKLRRTFQKHEEKRPKPLFHNATMDGTYTNPNKKDKFKKKKK